MYQKTRCIVLKTTKYGDNKLIIDFLSREEGRISAAWKIPSSPKARVKRQLFQPLTILDIDFSHSPRQQLALIRDARLATIYTSLTTDSTKIAIAFFIAEFLSYATRDTHCDPVLYDFVENSLLWLDSSDRGTYNFHLMFMMRASRFLGFFPDIESYSLGSLFDLREGLFCSYAPLHSDFLSASDAERLLLLIRMSPYNLHLFKMSRLERNHIIDLCLHFYRLHIPAFGEMKTLEVLREL